MDNNKNNPERKNSLDEFLESLQDNLEEKKPVKDFNLEKIVPILEEYFYPFALVGYTPDGNSVTFCQASNKKDMDALEISIDRLLEMHRIQNDTTLGS